ncbi:MAG: ester cyclase [Candidatus Nitrosopolaris sp.]
MADTQYKAITRRFIEEIFNARKLEAAKNFVTPDIIYHGIAEEVRGLEDFKKWVGEDLSAFSDMRITILDEIEEQNKVAIRWTLKTTHEKDFAGMAASHNKIEIEGTEIFRFEKDKIKEGWTIFNMAELVK